MVAMVSVDQDGWCAGPRASLSRAPRAAVNVSSGYRSCTLRDGQLSPMNHRKLKI
jgi:hypothetical protein